MRGKKVLQMFVFSIPLVLIVGLLFNAYTVQNKARIAEQNKKLCGGFDAPEGKTGSRRTG